MNRRHLVMVLIFVSGLWTVTWSLTDWLVSYHMSNRLSANAWSDMFFPLATYIPWIGLAMTIGAGLDLVGIRLPARLFGFDRSQIYLVFGMFALLIATGWSQHVRNLETGFWLSHVGTLGLAAGGVVLHIIESAGVDTERAKLGNDRNR